MTSSNFITDSSFIETPTQEYEDQGVSEIIGEPNNADREYKKEISELFVVYLKKFGYSLIFSYK